MHLKQIIIISTLFIIFTASAFGQTNKSFFIGIQPSITVELFYEEGELDINILPIVYEKPVGFRTNIKLLPVVNYHLGGSVQGVSDLALYAVLPIYFRQREY